MIAIDKKNMEEMRKIIACTLFLNGEVQWRPTHLFEEDLMAF